MRIPRSVAGDGEARLDGKRRTVGGAVGERRGEDGRLGLERSFRFEYSEDGIQRHIGKLVLFRDELVYFSGPVRGASVVPLH